MKILVTGAAGFIGSGVMLRLASRGDEVVGIDNINDYYDVRLKYGRLEAAGFERPFVGGDFFVSKRFPNCRFGKVAIDDADALNSLFSAEKFDKVVNLAAQAGVRYSITNPYAYIQSNIIGFVNVLEGCRNFNVKHLVFASSSSVYGLNSKVPFNETDNVDKPVSLYAASKKSDELMAFAYSKLYGFASTGLRYFTVYGPWGRPDMSPMLFASSILSGKPINVFNHGDMLRDFTFIDDIVEGTLRVVDSMPTPSEASGGVPYSIYNIGCGHPVKLMDFISTLEDALGKKAEKNFMDMQQGDVYETYADTTKLQQDLGYKPKVSLKEGVDRFVEWYLSSKNPLKEND
ncbi:MAG: NAD-dependent epimerase [Bacteroidales bacterium]